MKEENQQIERIQKGIYKIYGSEIGYLFGIPPEFRSAVESVIKIAVQWTNEEIKEGP
jgi:hypothetical protein